MTSVLTHTPVTWLTGKQPRIAWSRRDYHERLNLRRMMSRQQVAQPVFQRVPEREDVTCGQN
ncbi:MAG: hypothetical protein K8L99_17545 [Anaerolineae bacterium]|nr:hypothetical protein [Anaerolineae bacterium]